MSEYNPIIESMESAVSKIFLGNTHYEEIFNDMLDALMKGDEVLKDDPQLLSMSKELQRVTRKVISNEKIVKKDTEAIVSLRSNKEISSEIPISIEECVDKILVKRNL